MGWEWRKPISTKHLERKRVWIEVAGDGGLGLWRGERAAWAVRVGKKVCKVLEKNKL